MECSRERWSFRCNELERVFTSF